VSTFAIVAKAGGSDEGPENTLEAIAAALATAPPTWGRLAIEVDVRASSDGALVCLHDASLERTTNASGPVAARSRDAIRRLAAGPNGERVPLLEEVFEQVPDHEIVVDVHERNAGVAGALVRLLRRFGAGTRERILLASEHTRVVRALRTLDPGLRSAATKSEVWQKLLLGRLRLDGWSPSGHPWVVPETHRGLRVIDASFIRSAAEKGDDVWVFVVNGPDDVLRLRQEGVTGCFTTCPSRLAAELSTRAYPLSCSS
jgi:glycerophosphoryl diester phosphodiesterase